MGSTDCTEPVKPSRWPEDYTPSHDGGHIFSDVIESFGLFPLYNWDIGTPPPLSLSIYERRWIEEHRLEMENWMIAACDWSKSHHRVIKCHEQLCGPLLTITKYDALVQSAAKELPLTRFWYSRIHTGEDKDAPSNIDTEAEGNWRHLDASSGSMQLTWSLPGRDSSQHPDKVHLFYPFTQLLAMVRSVLSFWC